MSVLSPPVFGAIRHDSLLLRVTYYQAENRLNLQQVFNELEKLHMEPQVELHEARRTITTRGAEETFADAGTIVLTNKEVP